MDLTSADDCAPTATGATREPSQCETEMGSVSDLHTAVRDETETLSSQSTELDQEVSIWLDEVEQQHSKRQTLSQALGDIIDGSFSPILSTLNASWVDISATQQKYYLRKAKETIAASLSVINPRRENELWQSIRQESSMSDEQDGKSSKHKSFDTNTGLIDVLIKAHNQAQSWQTKRQILSLFANDFIRAELQKLVPGLSKWRIDQARQHTTQTGRGQPVLEQPIFRCGIDPVKIDHFIEYISRPELLQDVAFGTKTLKLDSGEKIFIPAVIRTLIPSRIIQQYRSYCTQQEFEPASERSMYRMLQVCSASMQKSLQGLGNVTADGTEAFDSLVSIVETLSKNRVEGQ